jgi:hypothetical protein
MRSEYGLSIQVLVVCLTVFYCDLVKPSGARLGFRSSYIGYSSMEVVFCEMGNLVQIVI